MAKKGRAEGTSSTTAGAAAGKGPAKTATAKVAAAKTALSQCDRVRSTFSKREEKKLRRLGLIPQEER